MANALMIDPHTGQPIEWTPAQGPSSTFGGLDPKMVSLYQQAGLWRPEYSAAVGDWGSDPASRGQARMQWESSPEYLQLQQSLNGWTQGQARKDYGLYDFLQGPDGKIYSVGSLNKGGSFHKDDYANMASVLLGGYGAAAGGAAGVGSSLYGLSGTQAAIAGGATLGAANGAVQAYGNDQNVLQGAAKGGVLGGAIGYASASLGGADPVASASDTSYMDFGQGDVPYSRSIDYGESMPVTNGDTGYMDFGQVSDPTTASEPSFRPSQNYGDGMTGRETSAYDTAIKSGGQNMASTPQKTTSLADFFSGDGSMSDYLRAGQALYGLYAQNKATDAAAAGNQAQLELMARMYDQNRADNQPLVDMRNSVLPQIQNLLKNPNSITSDPGYQFQLKQGQNALNNRAAASGNYYSGAQMKAAQQYGQDYAGTKLDQSLNRLTNVAGLGQVGSNMNQQNSNNYATQGGNALAQGGNIRGSGYLGQFNTVNGAINGWQQDSIWNNLLKGKGG